MKVDNIFLVSPETKVMCQHVDFLGRMIIKQRRQFLGRRKEFKVDAQTIVINRSLIRLLRPVTKTVYNDGI